MRREKKDNFAERCEDQKEKVIKIVDVGVPNLWGQFKDVVQKACDEVCGKKSGRRSKGDTWWWKKEVKEAI